MPRHRPARRAHVGGANADLTRRSVHRRNAMRKLLLVKHAPPLVDESAPSDRWSLSDRGRELCAPLAEALRPYAPARIVTSVEPKAAETGERVAALLGIPFATAPGLHEHDRTGVPHMRSREFISMIELAFRRPGERVLGRESADEALARFAAAVDSMLAAHPGGDLAVVTHGTVIALFASRHGAGNGF